uniref:Odorant receptor n=1 Tax=Tetraodon nigroviridis TaxID=99883 RepID=Q2PR55_TETNG|nr:odorant receptor [Tetraodon nigroviridis]
MDNVTAEQQYQGLLERLMFSFLTTVPCCIFFYINAIMLFTLRSKTVFCETSRYVLLFNLLFADTIQMVLSQVLYILAACLMRLTYPVCAFLNVIGAFTNTISPLTLVVMSLERYVAVCFPLRHAAVITTRNTGLAIFAILGFQFAKYFCSSWFGRFFRTEEPADERNLHSFNVFVGPLSDTYNKASTCLLFVSAGAAIIFSYIGVTVAAKSASTDKTTSQKARHTLLLHLVQLGLSLSSTLSTPVFIALSTLVMSIALFRAQNVLYVCFFILPRCLSALIYGIRDRTIRPVFLFHLCCRLTISILPAKGYK